MIISVLAGIEAGFIIPKVSGPKRMPWTSLTIVISAISRQAYCGHGADKKHPPSPLTSPRYE